MPVQYDDDADVDGFLSHRGSNFDRGAALGTKWHKDGKIDIWFFTRFAPKPRWKHGFQQVKAVTNKDTKQIEKQVWGDYDFVCHEPERVLKNRERNSDGSRVEPFQFCGFCRLIEHVRMMVIRGEISWVAPVFRFFGSDPQKAVTLHAGGLFNAFGARSLDDIKRLGIPENKAISDSLKQAGNDPANWWRSEMAAAHIHDGWKENCLSRLEYVMLVVQNSNPDGVKIAVEPDLLGQKIQRMIAATRESLNDDVRGNPFKSPYCVRWTCDKNAKDIKDKYNAIRLDPSSFPLSPAIEKLIRSQVAPDVKHVMTPSDHQTLRARMEAAATPEFRKMIDWDAIFKVRDPEAPHPVGAFPQAKAAAPIPSPASDEVPCDGPDGGPPCGYMLKPSDAKCPKCGTEYEIQEDPKPAPVAATPKQAAAPATPQADYGYGSGGDDDSDLPF